MQSDAQKYSKKLKKISLELEEINSVNVPLKSKNNKLKKELKEKELYIKELKSKLNKNNIGNKTDDDIEDKADIYYKNDNDMDEELLQQKINDLKKEIKNIEKYNQNNHKLEEKNANDKMTRKFLDDYIIKNKISQKIVEENEEKLSDLIENLNDNINILVDWIIPNFGEIKNDKKIDDLDINLIKKEINKNKDSKEDKDKDKGLSNDYEKAKFSSFCNYLKEKNQKIQNKYDFLIKRNEDLESEHNQLLSKLNELQKENDYDINYLENYSTERNKLIDELNTLNQYAIDLDE